MHRVLLDTNVWGDLADSGRVQEVVKACKSRSTHLLVALAAVNEILRIPNDEVRSRHLRVVTKPAWTRLMPEAFDESMEVLEEARRVRPEWLRQPVDRKWARTVKWDWMAMRALTNKALGARNDPARSRELGSVGARF